MLLGKLENWLSLLPKKGRRVSPLTLRNALIVGLLLSLFSNGRLLAGEIPGPKVAFSREGIVVTASPYATQAGVEMLERGGNAIDAAIASAFTLGVVEPMMSGLGGRTQILIRLSSGKMVGINGGTLWPRLWIEVHRKGKKPLTGGIRSVAVPGTPYALWEAQRLFGRLPFKEVLDPAIRYARYGYIVGATQSRLFAEAAKDLARDPSTRRYFLRSDGKPYQEGDWFIQLDLARTLEALTRYGPKVFYQGWIARRIHQQMVQQGGYLRFQDLASYRPRPGRILQGQYRKWTIVTLHYPSLGASVLETLEILEALEKRGRGLNLGTLALTLKQVSLDREEEERRVAGSSAFPRVISRLFAQQRAERILKGTPSAGDTPPPEEHTTHLVTADRWGNVVSLTQSLGPLFGAKVSAQGLGFCWGATLGYLEYHNPQVEPISSIAPVIVLEGGKPLLALGAAGGDRIPAAIAQVLYAILGQKMTPQTAMARARIAVQRAKEGTRWELVYETSHHLGVASSPPVEEERKGLEALGFTLIPLPLKESVGRVHLIAYDQQQRGWIGVADPRWYGSVGVPRRQVNRPSYLMQSQGPRLTLEKKPAGKGTYQSVQGIR